MSWLYSQGAPLMLSPMRWLSTMTAAMTLALASCATHPENPSFPLTSHDAEHAIAQMKAHPKVLDRPLVIVDGFLDPDIAAMRLSHFFTQTSHDNRIVTVCLAFCVSMEDCRQTIIAAVDKQWPTADPIWTTEVDVVGVSLGGLSSRYAAAPSRDAAHPRRLNVVRLFTISSPIRGRRCPARRRSPGCWRT